MEYKWMMCETQLVVRGTISITDCAILWIFKFLVVGCSLCFAHYVTEMLKVFIQTQCTNGWGVVTSVAMRGGKWGENLLFYWQKSLYTICVVILVRASMVGIFQFNLGNWADNLEMPLYHVLHKQIVEIVASGEVGLSQIGH